MLEQDPSLSPEPPQAPATMTSGDAFQLDALRDYAGKIVALQRTGSWRGRWVSLVCGSAAWSPFQNSPLVAPSPLRQRAYKVQWRLSEAGNTVRHTRRGRSGSPMSCCYRLQGRSNRARPEQTTE